MMINVRNAICAMLVSVVVSMVLMAVAAAGRIGFQTTAHHRYLNCIGIPESAIVDLKYHNYARSNYLALGMKDTMPKM